MLFNRKRGSGEKLQKICSCQWTARGVNVIQFLSGGAVSSVVEHFLDTEGVRGSNPLSRTIHDLIPARFLELLQEAINNVCAPAQKP
jgi:hypothetical protein